VQAATAFRPVAARRLLFACTWAWLGIASAQPQEPPEATPESLPTVTPPEPASPADAMPPSTPAASFDDAYAEFKRRFEQRDYAGAVEQGRVVLSQAERREPPDAEQLQVALMNLGLAQRMAGEYLQSEATYQRVIELIEGTGRLASARLGRAYGGLGLTYHAARRYDLAVPSFERAIALLRRSDGLFNEGQLPLLENQADALTELGRLEDALQAHRYALRLVGRRHGEESLRYAQELESFGRWYTRARAYESSRVVIREAVDLVVKLKGPDSLELVGPLTAGADNARRWLMDPSVSFTSSAEDQGRTLYHDPVIPGPPSLSPSMIASEGLRALERATAIVDARPDAPPASIAAVHVQLGDLFQIRQAPDSALPHYQRAWQAATRTPVADGRPMQELLFGEPLLLQYLLPDGWDRYAGRPADEAERRLVEIEATVTPEGRLQDPKLLSDAGDPKFAERALRAAETARYRPRFVDGQPVETHGVRFSQPLYVLREGEEPANSAGKPRDPPPEDKPQGGG
jgi:tetratricopeptide (TPR) repeat protein